jgi:hypothetical protein
MRARSSRTSAPTVCRDLPELLARWDVGFMPFALNDATRHISPTKTPDFCPLGYRWIPTQILDVVRTYGKAGLVRIAATAADFVLEIEGALRESRVDWIGEQMPGLPCARGTIRGDPWSTIFAALASGSKTRNVLDPNAAPPSSTGAVPAGLGSRC